MQSLRALKAKGQPVPGTGTLRQGHECFSPGNLGHDGGIDGGSLVAANRFLQDCATVTGGKAWGEECAGKQ